MVLIIFPLSRPIVLRDFALIIAIINKCFMFPRVSLILYHLFHKKERNQLTHSRVDTGSQASLEGGGRTDAHGANL